MGSSSIPMVGVPKGRSSLNLLNVSVH
jgi:hypothetical protein